MNQPNLSKTCSICGLIKPLSAFLQLHEAQGTSYGNVCSSCRKTALTQEKTRKTDAEGSTSSDSSHAVSAKTKVRGEADKRQLHKDIHEQYYDDRKTDEHITTQKIDKQHQTVKKEQIHRRSFLDQRHKPKTSDIPTQQAEMQAKQTKVKEAGNKEMDKQKTTDFTAPYVASQTGPLLKHGVGFKSFLQWVGNSSPVAKQTQEALKKVAKQNNVAVKDLEKEPTPEFVDKSTRPGSRKR